MGYDAFYDQGRESFFKGEIDLLVDDIGMILLDVDDISSAISGATYTTPVLVTNLIHGLSTGNRVAIQGVTGNPATNGVWKVVVTDDDNFTIHDPNTGADVPGNGTYIAGGTVVDLSNKRFLIDLAVEAFVSTQLLSLKTVSPSGVFDCQDITFPLVTGDQFESLLVYQNTGNSVTSKLIAFLGGSTGLPATPAGADIVVVVNSEGLFQIGDA